MPTYQTEENNDSTQRPRYLALREILVSEIAAGNPPAGSRFPTDFELSERFKVSRQTIREALRELQASGLLYRRRGLGTVVAASTSTTKFSQTVSSLAELDAYAAEATFEKLSESVVTVRSALAQAMGIADDESKWLRLAGLRRLRGKGRPLAWTEILIAEPFLSIRNNLRHGTQPYYEQVSSHFGVVVTGVVQQVSATSILPSLAGLLEAEAGAPALLVRRHYHGADGMPFEVSLSVHPADRYNVTTMLVRDPQRL